MFCPKPGRHGFAGDEALHSYGQAKTRRNATCRPNVVAMRRLARGYAAVHCALFRGSMPPTVTTTLSGRDGLGFRLTIAHSRNRNRHVPHEVKCKQLVRRELFWIATSSYLAGITTRSTVGDERDRANVRGHNARSITSPSTADRLITLHDLRELTESERQTDERRGRLARERKRKAIIDAVKTAHADAFAQPLIDSRLLTAAERKRIRERVRFSPDSGRWNENGATRRRPMRTGKR